MAFNPNFEPIYAALFALLQTAPGFVTTNRLLRHWADVSAGEQAALFMPHGKEISRRQMHLPAVWTIEVMAWIYAMSPDPALPTSLVLNPLIGAVRGVIVPAIAGTLSFAPGQRQTLGGLVGDMWIEGEIITDEGFLGAQGVARIPIHILVNGP